ncbi:MAG TPA: C40 family peptidase [Steroidobacteraceae bacterium]|jgi:cell wall-associated NlpC family hydrolase|nr:C40 family peptidase [Steroidobacteraceae bacterium]
MIRINSNQLPDDFSRNMLARVITLIFLLALGACSTTPHQTDSAVTPVPETHHTREATTDTEPAGVAESVMPPEPSALPPTNEKDTLGEEIALRAIALVGKPYHYGGFDLKGFDCSGLVYYIYRELGMDVPRSALEQHQRALHIEREELLPGDLVFFQINRRRISHVGIYVGDNRFVHSPQTGKRVELRNLDDAYFAKRLVGAGRLQ